MYTPLMYYSQFFICASLTIITYGCSRRRVYGSEKVETTKKDVAAVASNSTSETRETPVEITAKSDRAEWFPQEAPKLELQERRKPSLQEQRKQMAMYEESKGPHAPKPLSMDYFKLKPTTEGGPNGKRAEPPAQIKNVLMKTAIIVTPKSDADKFRSLKLEPISFLDSENRNEELKRASQDDETINDAPSLARVNISKDSEEMPSSQGQIKAKAEVGEKLPTAKEVSLDESQLYPLQKTMGSQRLEANEILALDKTPYPSSEGRANQ